MLVGLLFIECALAGAPVGTWLSEDGGTKVHIAKCGGKLCGKVVWLDEPTDPQTGKPKTDAHNPDPAKRSRPLLGVRVSFTASRPTARINGRGLIYNADDGHTYQRQFEGPRCQ